MVPTAEQLAAVDPRVEIAAVFEPARSVGGDFYDAVALDAGRVLFMVGDVTGKGVPAALFMALSKALSKSNLIRGAHDLAASVARLNTDLMAEADVQMGVTMLVGVLDHATGHVAMVNAGHEQPLVVAADGAVRQLDMRGGPPFCVVDFPYEEEEFALGPGDTLVLVTDGATEAEDAGGAFFGTDRVRAAFGGSEQASALERVTALAEAVRTFESGTRPSDDLTILALRRVSG